MKSSNKLILLKDLKSRCSKNQRGLLALFRDSGVQLKNDKYVSLIDMKRLQQQNPTKFSEALDYLYPERAKVANAGFDWQSLVGGILSGAGGALSDNSTYDKQTESALLLEQQEAARYEREKSANTQRMYLLGGLALAIIIVVAIIYSKRK